MTHKETLERIGFFKRRPRVFSIELEDYTVDIFMRPRAKLVVCFDHAGIAENNPDRARTGWGFNFLHKHTEYAGLFVKPTSSNWFRKPGLYDLCAKMRDEGLFDHFTDVMTYGGSMGGYAALAYADAFCASSVLSLNPQATLADDLAPWETRFGRGKAQDWSTTPRIASEGCQKPAKVIVGFDRRCAEDARHVDMLDIPHMTELNIPFIGHGIPYHLAKMGLLERLFFDVAENRFDVAEWRRLVRARRALDDYKTRIQEGLEARRIR